MPDKQLTMAGYAAGASLAAITLVYVFGPTFFIDGEAAGASASSRKRGVVGLSNPANDCFINSVLQALAGLGDLRLYLIRETHRRNLDGQAVYLQLVEDPARKGIPDWKIEGLQTGMVTLGLKGILDTLNERPITKKTISASPFVVCLESAFKQRISRQQQDAQEFLQVVAERLCDEYHAGHRARSHARKRQSISDKGHALNQELVDKRLKELVLEESTTVPPNKTSSQPQKVLEDVDVDGVDGERPVKSQTMSSEEDGFPLEGESQSQIECLTCGFKPKPTTSTFCSITLSVPQVSSTSLSSCFDSMFKTEYIEDFRCEKCRLLHALETFKQEVAKSNSENFKIKTQAAIEKIESALETNPEDHLKDVELPDRKFAPKRKIAKHVRITKFPKIMAIHLSRSIFDMGNSTMKNSAKVSFQEQLPLGGLLSQRMYKLSSVVCHKGSHHSGHYESFRRQTLPSPFSTPNTFQAAGVYSRNTTPVTSQESTPPIGALQRPEDASTDENTLSSTPELLSPISASSISLPFANGTSVAEQHKTNGSSPLTSNTSSSTAYDPITKPAPTSAPRDSDTSSIRSFARSARSKIVPSSTNRSSLSPPMKAMDTSNSSARETVSTVSDVMRGKRKKHPTNRWWRISDEKIKESRTNDVLSMQKEVYMLFYEIEKDDTNLT